MKEEVQVSHSASIGIIVLGDCLILLVGVGLPAPHWASTDTSIRRELGVLCSFSSHGLQQHYEDVLLVIEKWRKSFLPPYLGRAGTPCYCRVWVDIQVFHVCPLTVGSTALLLHSRNEYGSPGPLLNLLWYHPGGERALWHFIVAWQMWI